MNYSPKEKIKAIKPYKKIGSITKTVKKLGYPKCRRMLYNWVAEYERTGAVTDKRRRRTENATYNQSQIDKALTIYHKYGKGIKATVAILGYPSISTLRKWVMTEGQKSKMVHSKSDEEMLKYIANDAVEAAVEFCSGKLSLNKAAVRHNLSRRRVKEAAAILLNKGSDKVIRKPETSYDSDSIIQSLRKEKAELEKERNAPFEQIHYLQMERDALVMASKLLKKVAGISLKTMNDRQKVTVIGALRPKYRLKRLLVLFGLSKSSYCYQRNAICKPDKDVRFRELIKTIFFEYHKEYGYRRIHAVLKRQGICLSEKRIRRIMYEENLAVYQKKSAKFNSYKGEISPSVSNVINRNFNADEPNEKWLTDITEFAIPAGKVYLSPVIDCFDGMPVSWKIGTSPNAKMANTMLDEAVMTLRKGEHPIVHSDRGSHYRWQGWISRMEQYGLTRSMSKKGCSPDNSACEGFFGLIKNAMFYGRDWKNVTISEFIDGLDKYLHWFRKQRIKKKLGYKSPLEYCMSIGIPFCTNVVHCQV